MHFEAWVDAMDFEFGDVDDVSVLRYPGGFFIENLYDKYAVEGDWTDECFSSREEAEIRLWESRAKERCYE